MYTNVYKLYVIYMSYMVFICWERIWSWFAIFKSILVAIFRTKTSMQFSILLLPLCGFSIRYISLILSVREYPFSFSLQSLSQVCQPLKATYYVPSGCFFFFFFFNFFYFFLICSEFCHTLKWNVLKFTCLPHPDPPSHLPLHPLPPGPPRAPGPSACLMHPTWAGDLFHPW